MAEGYIYSKAKSGYYVSPIDSPKIYAATDTRRYSAETEGVESVVYSADFTNNAAYCVGTGRMGLVLHKEYLDQLAMAQELAHFKHIRGHGLFCDDMAIYQPYTD